jgi:hypothetical protein
LDTGVDGHPVVQFATAARRLGAAARAAGLAVPAFRSPPRHPSAARTIRRLPGGTVIAVRVRERAFADVLADMIDGVLTANDLRGEAADRVRRTLYAAASVSEPRDEPPPRSVTAGGQARVAERQTQAA